MLLIIENYVLSVLFMMLKIAIYNFYAVVYFEKPQMPSKIHYIPKK